MQVLFPGYVNGQLLTDRKQYLPTITQKRGYPAKVIAVDIKRDLALLELPALPAGAVAVPFAPQGATKGKRVYHFGNPGNEPLWRFLPNTVLGVGAKKGVSKKEGQEDRPVEMVMLETDLPSQTGQSGCMVVNKHGELVGVHQSHSLDKEPRTAYVIERDEVVAFLAANRVEVKLLGVGKAHVVGGGDGLKVVGKLSPGDPPGQKAAAVALQVFLVKLSAGKAYTLRLNAANPKQLDTVLRLEDDAGKELAFNDDAPDEMTLNSRIDFKCERTGTYRVIATSLNPAAVGDFTVLVKLAD